MDKKRLTFIDLLEVIATLFVLLYHSSLYSCDFLSDASLGRYFLYYSRTILSTCVPLFFFANGYLLFGRDFDLRKHILKMAKLVFITAIWGIITLLLLQIIRHEYFSLKDLLISLWNWKQGWINHLWYMGALVCIYVFFPLLKHVYDTNMKIFYYFTLVSALLTFGNTTLNQASTICISFLLGKSTVLTDFNFFNMFNPYRGIWGYTFVYFCLGGIMCYLKDTIETIPIKKRNIISIIGMLVSCMGLFVVGVFYSKKTGLVWDVVWNGYDTIFTFINVIFIYVLCLNWKTDNRYIRTISSNSLGIYFIHGIIISLFRPHLINYEFLKNLPFNLIFVGFLLLVCLIICLFLRKIPIISKLIK